MDKTGNRTRLQYNDGGSTTTSSYLYNPADQLTRETVGETNTDYLYDANGSLTRKDDGTNTYDYAYDFRNRRERSDRRGRRPHLMTSYDGPGTANDATYAYDLADRRVQRVVGGSTTTNYYHDGLNVVAEYNGSDQLQRTYVTPGLDANLSMTASGSTYYYLTDALGSVRQLIDSNEATQNSYDYFAFGKVYGTPTENVTQRRVRSVEMFLGDTPRGSRAIRDKYYVPNGAVLTAPWVREPRRATGNSLIVCAKAVIIIGDHK